MRRVDLTWPAAAATLAWAPLAALLGGVAGFAITAFIVAPLAGRDALGAIVISAIFAPALISAVIMESLARRVATRPFRPGSRTEDQD